MAEWYYIGHYGQLGPLTREQIDELVDGGVIGRDTFVWRTGMPSWVQAGQSNELLASFQKATPLYSTPPPPPSPTGMTPPPLPTSSPYGTDMAVSYAGYNTLTPSIVSDRSRALAGILQILIPGVGRMYLGYAAYGVLQLLLSPCFVGWVWSVIDGLLILTGSVKLDGYGRTLKE